MEKIYVLYMDDFSLPCICSGEKKYFGTKDDLLSFYLSVRKTGISSMDLNKLYYFINSNSDKNYTQTYNNHLLGEKAIVLGKENVSLDKKQWTHLNVWKFDYQMKFEACNASIIWIRHKRKYYRCLKPEFLNLTYSSDWGEKKDLAINHFWGQQGFFNMDKEWLKCNLYVIDKEFESKEAIFNDLENFDANTFDFKEVINEIFGDG